MKLLYVTSIVQPSILANRKQIIETAKALHSLLGDNIKLGIHSTDKQLPLPYVLFGGSHRSVILGLRYALHIRKNAFTHVYCREEKLFVMMRLYARLLQVHAKFFFEAHTVDGEFFFRGSVRLADGIVVITKSIKDDLVALGIAPERIIVVPDAVSPEQFFLSVPKKEARAEIGVSQDGLLIVYAGSFGYYHSWKGVDTLLEASKQGDSTWRFLLIGGRDDEVKFWRKRYSSSRIDIRNHLESDMVAKALRAADILVIPNKPGNETSERYTSPLKLFEYMASGTPIVASNLPSMQEVVSEEEAVFFEPGNSRSLVQAIQSVVNDPVSAQKRAEAAREKVQNYTWNKRAQTILGFLNTINALEA